MQMEFLATESTTWSSISHKNKKYLRFLWLQSLLFDSISGICNQPAWPAMQTFFLKNHSYFISFFNGRYARKIHKVLFHITSFSPLTLLQAGLAFCWEMAEISISLLPPDRLRGGKSGYLFIKSIIKSVPGC